MNIVKPSESAHWYEAATGKPMHTVIGANGVERPTTLRDARKLNLLPSVTTVLNIIRKPGLEAWKMETVLEAALTTPRGEFEDLHTYAERCIEEADRVSGKAADFGTRIHAVADWRASHHKQLEEMDAMAAADLRSQYAMTVDQDLRPYLSHLEIFFAGVTEVVEAESVVVGDGYAGRIDLLIRTLTGRLTLVDFKSRKFKDKAPSFYPENVYQLAAYRDVLERKYGEAIQCWNVGINSQEPAPFYIYLWSEEEVAHGYDCFERALHLWQSVNKYFPKQ